MWKKRIIKIFIGILLLTIFLLLWEQFVIQNDIPKRILPRPSEILSYLYADIIYKNSLLIKSLQSFIDCLIGLGTAVILGSIIGIIFSSNKIFKIILSPFALITQLIPVPAFAPVVAAFLGYGMETKIFIILLFMIFPVIVTVEKAIVTLPESYFALMKTYNAKRITLITKLVFPAIVPKFLVTLKVLATASFVTSIIAELPLTVSTGIGKDIYNSFNNQINVRVWASLIIISFISLAFFTTIVYLEKIILLKFRYDKE